MDPAGQKGLTFVLVDELQQHGGGLDRPGDPPFLFHAGSFAQPDLPQAGNHSLPARQPTFAENALQAENVQYGCNQEKD